MIKTTRGFLAFLSYLCWLFVEIAKSSFSISMIIWSRNIQINPTIVSIATKQSSDWLKVLYANSITLTPGTITISLDQDTLVIHSLTSEGVRDLLSGVMDNKCSAICSKI